ncbi:hypothetical protein NKI41_01390 [Mesorhizobium sp. M0601]|uniref:hypothetical protein n=1 Tax=unclassified Mesorhizobium TaxID=325217 RepID=UPI003335A18C
MKVSVYREFCERLMMSANEIDVEVFKQIEQQLHWPEVRSSRDAVSPFLGEISWILAVLAGL